MPCPKCGAVWQNIGPEGGKCRSHGFFSHDEIDNHRNGDRPADEIDLGQLLTDVRRLVRRFVVLNDYQADAVALWAAHTHALDAFDATPYVSVTSPEKRSGKSRLLEVMELIVARPWFTGRTSPAALYRKTDAEQVTLLLDESDAAFKGDKEYSEALRGVLNSGWRRGGKTTACVGQGTKIGTVDFNTFSAKAIAGIGTLPDTIADRSIKIEMKRRAPSETVERFRRREIAAEAQAIREALSRWASAAVSALTEARPEIPGELDDRAAEGWEPLLAIADMAGGDWPERARAAAEALSIGDGREDDSFGVRLLRDIREVFDGHAEDRLASADIVADLVADESAPWGDLKGKPIGPRSLARLLRRYGVRPRSVRLQDGSTPKGYHREDFSDLWDRYCPPPPPENPPQAQQAPQTPDTDTEDVADVADVAANPGVGEDGPRKYLVDLGEAMGFPNIPSVMPRGRLSWESAARVLRPDQLMTTITKIEEWMKESASLPPTTSQSLGRDVSQSERDADKNVYELEKNRYVRETLH